MEIETPTTIITLCSIFLPLLIWGIVAQFKNGVKGEAWKAVGAYGILAVVCLYFIIINILKL